MSLSASAENLTIEHQVCVWFLRLCLFAIFVFLTELRWIQQHVPGVGPGGRAIVQSGRLQGRSGFFPSSNSSRNWWSKNPECNLQPTWECILLSWWLPQGHAIPQTWLNSCKVLSSMPSILSTSLNPERSYAQHFKAFQSEPTFMFHCL